MGPLLLVVPGIESDELEVLQEYCHHTIPVYQGCLRIYILDRRPTAPFRQPGMNIDETHGNFAVHGTISDLSRDFKKGITSGCTIMWIPDISLFLDSIPDFQSVIGELYPRYSIAIGTRSKVPLFQRIFGKILFPDLKDPYSDRFLVETKTLKSLELADWHGPVLPHILAQLKQGSVKEFSWESKKSVNEAPRQGVVSQMMGIIQILARVTRCREGMIRKEMKTLIRFALVGISGIVVNTGILFVLTEYAHIFYLISSAIAIETSILSNFLLNERWTFLHRAFGIVTCWKRFLSYNLLSLGGMVVNMGILFLLTEFAGIYYLFANIIGIFTAFSWNYLLNRNITWK